MIYYFIENNDDNDRIYLNIGITLWSHIFPLQSIIREIGYDGSDTPGSIQLSSITIVRYTLLLRGGIEQAYCRLCRTIRSV